MSLSKFVLTHDYVYSKESLKRTREVKEAEKVSVFFNRKNTLY
jgi:hypothetical protein